MNYAIEAKDGHVYLYEFGGWCMSDPPCKKWVVFVAREDKWSKDITIFNEPKNVVFLHKRPSCEVARGILDAMGSISMGFDQTSAQVAPQLELHVRHAGSNGFEWSVVIGSHVLAHDYSHSRSEAVAEGSVVLRRIRNAMMTPLRVDVDAQGHQTNPVEKPKGL